MALQRKRAIGAVLAAAAVALPLAGCSQDADNAQTRLLPAATSSSSRPAARSSTTRNPSASRCARSPARMCAIGIRPFPEDYEGEIVVLNSWGQWCAPCRAEADDLQEIHSELQKRKIGTVLGINVRDYNPQVSNDFLKDNGLTYPPYTIHHLRPRRPGRRAHLRGPDHHRLG